LQRFKDAPLVVVAHHAPLLVVVAQDAPPLVVVRRMKKSAYQKYVQTRRAKNPRHQRLSQTEFEVSRRHVSFVKRLAGAGDVA